MPTAIYERDTLAVDQPVAAPRWSRSGPRRCSSRRVDRADRRDRRPGAGAGRAVDPVTMEVIRGGLAAAAVEMNRTLVRTAHNPLLYEVQDFGLGIVGADGRLWAEAPGIAGFISALSDTVRSGIETHGLDGFSEGDVLIVNDPFLTGTHISDTSVYSPVFHGGALIGFCDRHRPLGGHRGEEPGGWSPDTTDVYQEGICFTHQRLVRAGEPNDELMTSSSQRPRPGLVRGDLAAQLASCRRGIERVQRLCDRYGAAPGHGRDGSGHRADRGSHASADRRAAGRPIRGERRARPRRHRPNEASAGRGTARHRR